MRGQKEKKRESEGWGMVEEESEVFLVRNEKEKRKEISTKISARPIRAGRRGARRLGPAARAEAPPGPPPHPGLP